MQERYTFTKFKEVGDVFPPLLEIQQESWSKFLQADIPPQERKNQGLQQLFLETFPISDVKNVLILEFLGYRIGKPKYTEEECREKGLTYSVPWYAHLRLIRRDTGELKEQEVYMREMPLMTDRATFIINGAERVVVSQLYRSPGIYYEEDKVNNIFTARILPDRGVWLEFELNTNNNIIYVRLGKKRKLAATVILRIFGLSSNEDIISAFHEIKSVNLSDEETIDKMVGYRIVEDIVADDKIVMSKFTKFERKFVEELRSLNIENIKLIIAPNEAPIINTLAIDDTKNQEEAMKRVYQVLRPGERVDLTVAKLILERLFFDSIRYNLGKIGRYKINKKLGLSIPESQILLTKEDLIAILQYLIRFSQKHPATEADDIDHLGNRGVRSVGELLQIHLRVGFLRMARAIREKLSIQDPSLATPQTVCNIKPLLSAIQSFFCTNPLSQFMDQTNPLSELTHKRRLSALGAGGVVRERAGFDVRDVHPSHYGRICPIETPEGPNIGLITSLSTCARINEYGFIETPYRRVIDGKITDEIVYLSADEEEDYKIAPGDIPRDENNNIIPQRITIRKGREFLVVSNKEIDLVDASLNQLTGVSASLIPFLEHDDANRALMGSNMQRQAVPLLFQEQPLVGTGIEKVVVKNCKIDIISEEAGVVEYVSADKIIIKTEKGNTLTYKLRKFQRTNQCTCINQRPLVRQGDRVEKNQVLTDGTATKAGELALGKNLLVAFMPFEGYNFEDAILISDRLVKEDVFTSLHIEEFEVEARDTQLGPEYITRDIPNVPEEFLKHLDERGIVRIGYQVRKDDIIVGRVAPKGETPLSPEYKLLHSIFGEKVKDVKDTSVRIPPHAAKGVVINVIYFSVHQGDNLAPGVLELVKVYVAVKRKISVGDKISGRHGNKGVISKILPQEDMPYLEDGTPVDIILNPLSVPSRMNLGQILEMMLSWVAKKINIKIASPVFNGISEEEVGHMLEKAGLPKDCRVWLYDGKTGRRFDQKVTVGYMYIMKLSHLVEDKIHARSIGPYSLITQQPLGGKAHFGGQRLGEMEVWALEAYGASNTLQELLTVKSDDIIGRAKVYEAIVRGGAMPRVGLPESFNVIMKELQALALDVKVLDDKGQVIEIDKIE